jgi:hypothetical protein
MLIPTSTLSRRRRLLAVAASVSAAAAVFAGVNVVHAASAPDASSSYTGCLRTQGDNVGKLFAVKAGSNPGRPCTADESVLVIAGGDLTSFRVGTGLKDTSPEKYLGTTPKGSVSVELAPSYRLPQGCETSGTPTWNGSTWVCMAPEPEPEAPRPIRYFDLHHHADGHDHPAGMPPVGNNWANIGHFEVPAGSWEFLARVQYWDTLTGDASSIYCRLDVTGKTGIDWLHEHESESISTLTLSAFHTASSPFTVAVACKDSVDGSSAKEAGMLWETVRIHARPTLPAVNVGP